jgi:hypothetical protein
LVKKLWGSKKSKKAIAARGWGPLNYCLLDHQQFGNVNNQNDIISPRSNALDLSTINVTSGAARDYLDQLIMDCKKDDGSIARWHQMHQFSADKNDAIMKLKVLKRMTAPQLAVQQHSTT